MEEVFARDDLDFLFNLDFTKTDSAALVLVLMDVALVDSYLF